MKREGRHLSVRMGGEEAYRVTHKPDGHWVACDRYENGIGDNIALLREASPGLSFTEAVHQLTGERATARLATPAPVQPLAPPKMPPETAQDRAHGREYLKGRGVGAETLERAEKAGFLAYTGGGVLFLGREGPQPDARVRAVTKRASDPAAEVQKRDFAGTDKAFAPILPGDPRRVLIVEGGVDALAAHEMARSRRQEPPTVIVSGGVNVKAFLEQPHVQQLLKGADRVTLATEREKDADTQARADAAREKQAERVREITGKQPATFTPREGCKDLAEHVKYERDNAQRLQMQRDMANYGKTQAAQLEENRKRKGDLSL